MFTNARERNENQVRIYDPDDLEWNAEHQVCHFKGTTLSAAQQVVVKFEVRATLYQLGGERLGSERRHAPTASPREPERLLVLAPEISAGTISPILSTAAATCTFCR